MDLNPEVEIHIGRNVPWTRLPVKVKEIFGNSQKGYEKAVIAYSVRNQLRFSENMIKTIRKDEGKYYEEVVNYSKDHLMLYPYHLSDRVVKGLRITPFQYYTSVMEMIMEGEKSYDSLPNFTAADCLRLLGIGRNQYIELMNKHRASRKLFRRKPPRELLPSKPVDISIDPWFKIHVGYVTEEDIALTKPNERKIIDYIIDNGGQRAGTLDYDCVHSLYRKGLIYVDVPIENDDYIVVPPLEGFVMNRVLGDYFETLLYKIFVSIDEHTTVGELSGVLDIEAQLIKNAVSLYCRLGFAYKKNIDIDVGSMDPSWKEKGKSQNKCRNSYIAQDESSIADELSSALAENDSFSSSFDLPMQVLKSPEPSSADHSILSTANTSSNNQSKRIAFLYDSTLTAFLMMGNLSPGLKNHAVTMFEVGKIPDESLDSFLSELENISWTEGEGEAQRYFEHAKTLRKTILFLRNNPNMKSMSLDLLRCESLLNLDKSTCSRLLNKNYELAMSMAPLSYEVKPVCSENLPHFGPAIPQVNSIWFKLFLYSVTNSGPTSLLLSRGTLLNELPLDLEDCDKYLVTSWGHDASVIPGANAIFTLNDALTHSAVFVQAYGLVRESSTVIVPFPLTGNDESTNSSPSKRMYAKWAKHPAIVKLSRLFDLEKNCGYITMMNIRGSSNADVPPADMGIAKSDVKQFNVLPRSSTLNVIQEDQNNMDLAELVMAENDEGEVIISGSVARPLAEPQNGFKDDQSAKIYQEELDNELDNELSSSEFNVKPRGFDSRQQKIESLRLDLSDLSGLIDKNIGKSNVEIKSTVTVPNKNTTGGTAQGELDHDKLWFNDWTLLDCQFGLPLFDSGINEIVCEQLVSKGLWEEQSLEQLVKFNKDLGQQLTNFINTYQVPSTWNEETPLPSKSFYCQNGRLQEYEPCDF